MHNFLSFLGYPNIIPKSDQESALEAAIERVKSYRGSGQTMDEQSPVQSSQSNGEAERTVQSAEGQIRTLASALEERNGATLHPDDCIVPWLAIHAANRLATLDVRDNGKATHENLRSKTLKKTSHEFGELNCVLPPCREDEGKSLATWHDGVYLGFRVEAGEELVGTPDGVYKVRSIRRRPAETGWSLEHIRALKGSPWKPYLFKDEDKLQARLPMPASSPQPAEVKPFTEDSHPAHVQNRTERYRKIGTRPRM